MGSTISQVAIANYSGLAAFYFNQKPGLSGAGSLTEGKLAAKRFPDHPSTMTEVCVEALCPIPSHWSWHSLAAKKHIARSCEINLAVRKHLGQHIGSDMPLFFCRMWDFLFLNWHLHNGGFPSFFRLKNLLVGPSSQIFQEGKGGAKGRGPLGEGGPVKMTPTFF